MTEPTSTRITLEKQEIDGIVSKIKKSREDLRALRDRRKPVFDAYARKPFNEQEGRSNYQSADVFNQTEGTFPTLMGQARATDNQIRVKGRDPQVAKALLVKCRETIAENNDFLLFSCMIKDGLLAIVGTSKMWWERTYNKIVEIAAGVTEEKVAALEELLAAGEIHGLDVDEEPREGEEVGELGSGIHIVAIGPRTFRVKVTIMELDKSRAVIIPLPPEQVLFERGKAHINDSLGCGHEVNMTVGELLGMQERLSTPDEPFFDPEKLKLAISLAGKDEEAGQQQEREGREELAFEGSSDGRLDFNLTGSQLRRPIKVVEWCDNAVHDGKIKPVLVWLASDIELRVQENEDGFVPLSCWSPYIIPHSVIGMGVGEQHVLNQDSKSQLGRSLLDHVARAADEEVYILNAGTDILGLKNRRAGGLVYAEPGKDFVRGTANTLDAKLFQAFEFLKTDVHDTGPTNRWTMGANVDPQNTTATGQALMSQASSVRQNMILLVFVECLVDMYNKLIKLIQKNCEQFTVEVEGETITLTREQIQGSYVAFSQVERQFDPNSSQMIRATMMKNDLIAMSQMAPWMVQPQNLFNAEKRWLMELGETNVTEYITPPPELMPGQAPAGPDQALGSEAPIQMQTAGVS